MVPLVLTALSLGLVCAYQPATPLRPVAAARVSSPVVCALPMRRFRKGPEDDENVDTEVMPESPADSMNINVEEAAKSITEMPKMPEVQMPDVDYGKALDDTATAAVKGIDAVVKFNEEYKVVENTKGAIDSAVEWASSEEAAETFENTMTAIDNAKKWSEENEVGLKVRAVFEMGFEGLKSVAAAGMAAAAESKAKAPKKKMAPMKPTAKPTKKAPFAKGKKAPPSKDGKKFGLF